MSHSQHGPSPSWVNRFLQQVLLDRQQGRERSLEQYQEQFPGDVEAVAQEYRLLHAAEAGALSESDLYPAKGERYRNASQIGSGGMGTVLRVYDPALERDVAMKKLAASDGRFPEPHVLGRFLDEAKVTGQLQHPGIVSVLEIGLDERRVPYFTMPLIAGSSLQQVLGAMQPGCDAAGGEGWSIVRVLGVLVRVSEAVAYAHDRGVVHRDLKPANVMVGAFGETYVVDWGLARRTNRSPSDGKSVVDTSDELQLSPLRTIEGDVVGTPAYMAPEQARGELDRVAPLSDVYSLGAMLYHLLAGCAPYLKPEEDATGAKTLERLLGGPPERLAQLAPNAPGELVAICERAMQRDPVQRYRSAQEMGDDLRAFLENRVVQAFATGRWARVRKWARRNRGLALASAAAVLLLVGGVVVSEFYRNRAEANAVLATGNARLAAENLDLAFAAGDDLLGDLSLYQLQNEPGADPVREALATKALAYYERVREFRGEGVRVAMKVAKAHFRIAMLQTWLGHASAASRSWQEASERIEALVQRVGLTDELALRRAHIETARSSQALQRGEVAAAITGLEQARSSIAPVLASKPESPRLLRLLCYIGHNLSLAMIETRNRKGAIRYTQETVEASRRLASLSNPEPGSLAQFGSALTLRGRLHWQLGKIDEANGLYEEAERVLESALEAHPGDRGLQFRLGEACNLHAILRQVQQQPGKAAALFERASDIFRALATDSPGVRSYHGNLGGALCNRGLLKSLAGDFERAIPLLEEARAQVERALRIDPDAADYRNYRRIGAIELATALLQIGRDEDAAKVVRELMALQPDGSRWKAAQLLAACAKSQRDRACASDAMGFLEEAAELGRLKPGALDGSAFDALRQRSDFQDLLKKLQR